MIAKYRKKVTLFYLNEEYKFLHVRGKKEAAEWMRKETQLMPSNKRHLYYFTIPSLPRQNKNHEH